MSLIVFDSCSSSGSNPSLLVPFPGQKDCRSKGTSTFQEGSRRSILDGSFNQYGYHHPLGSHAETKMAWDSSQDWRQPARHPQEPVQTMASSATRQLLSRSSRISSLGCRVRSLFLEHLLGQCLAKRCSCCRKSTTVLSTIQVEHET